jgi:hypothetical protein
VLANGDHMQFPETPGLDHLACELDRRRTERHGGNEGESWSQWWDAVLADPCLGDATAQREQRQYDHPADEEVRLTVHEGALRDAGFTEIGVVWRKGTDAVLAALR